MTTRFEMIMAWLDATMHPQTYGKADAVKYFRSLEASHEALLKAAKDVNNSLEPDWDALKEAIRSAEELER